MVISNSSVSVKVPGHPSGLGAVYCTEKHPPAGGIMMEAPLTPKEGTPDIWVKVPLPELAPSNIVCKSKLPPAALHAARVSFKLATGGFLSKTRKSSLNLSVVPVKGHSKLAVITTLRVEDETEDGVKVLPETPVPLKPIPRGTQDCKLMGMAFRHTV